jgi:hypothetical protein
MTPVVDTNGDEAHKESDLNDLVDIHQSSREAGSPDSAAPMNQEGVGYASRESRAMQGSARHGGPRHAGSRVV